jgi:tetratricopeptide (TPR) repeat protein
LRRSQELFSAEISEEDAAFLSGSEMASPPGVHHLAVALAHTPLPVGRRSLLSGITFWAGATAAVVLLATVSLGIWFQHRRSPERVLAEVYTHCRCYDMRLAGADYSSVNPRSRMRGLESSQDLTALFKIRRQIEENLQSSPADPYWLQMEARVDLLEEKIDPAVAILDSLLLSAPSNVALLEDDAMAHYQRGIITACEADREIALERLKRADDLAPDNSVVLFNEAIVQEDRQQLSLAAQTWNRYLHLERDPQWISEGRSRLQKLEVKMQNSPGK